MSFVFDKKGKRKKEKKYLSVILVPHSHDNVKVLKFSALKSKIFIAGSLALSLFIIVGLCIFTVNTVHNNQKLKESKANLEKLNYEQEKTISQKSGEIDELNNKYDSLSENADRFNDLFKEMTEAYLDKSAKKTNRSGDRNESTFAKDIDRLKNVLNSINEESGSTSSASDDISKMEERLKKYIAAIPTLWPAKGRLSSEFGVREDPFNYGKGIHKGIDIAADYGQAIVASADGTVILSDWYSGYGKAVVIDHGRGITTVYGHASQLLAGEGKKVKKGDLIARIGSSGRSTGPHLHFEIRINGEAVNPVNYLDSNN